MIDIPLRDWKRGSVGALGLGRRGNSWLDGRLWRRVDAISKKVLSISSSTCWACCKFWCVRCILFTTPKHSWHEFEKSFKESFSRIDVCIWFVTSKGTQLEKTSWWDNSQKKHWKAMLNLLARFWSMVVRCQVLHANMFSEFFQCAAWWMEIQLR